MATKNSTNSIATLTEMNYLSGVTSAIQTQINSKQATLSGTGFVKSTAGTISYDTSTYLTTASASSTYQPLDSDLTVIASLVATTDNFIQSKGSAWSSRTVAQVKTDLGISNVDNTSDVNKPISTATQTALDTKLGIQIAIFRDEKTSGTAGGTSTAGTTAARTLNTTHTNTITGCSLASNQITLTAGTYRIRASAPAFICDKHKLRWYNVTDAAYSVEGTSSYSDAATNVVQTDANLVGRFTIAGTKVFELRHYIQSGRATNGLGVTIGQGTEVYAQVEIIKE